MRHIFISDLHLCPAREDLKKAYFHFCEHTLKAGDTLYILGDFFDAWIGDDEDNPFYIEIKNQLHTLSQNHTVYFMHGNRDFLIGEQFALDTGVILLNDPTPLKLGEHTCLLMHGDSLCTDDTQYMAFREQARSPAWQADILALPLAQRRQVAQELREKSKSLNSNKSEDIMDVSISTVEQTFQAHQATTLIHGHTHRPHVHQHHVNNQACQRMVLGDWDKTGWYIVFDDNSKQNNPLALIEFDV